MQILMSSRRTVMSGEVVTFATEFKELDGAFGPVYDALGPFEVSASRDAVIVHRAECTTADCAAALVEAVLNAEAVRASLAPHWRGGHPSLYPNAPTVCHKPHNYCFRYSAKPNGFKLKEELDGNS